MLITCTSHKGGVGKSTTSIHLAAYLAEKYGGESVALVDTDPNESVLDWAGRAEEIGGERPPFRVLGPDEEIWEEHVVFDSQGRLHGDDLEAAAEVSDLLVVPTAPDYWEIRALARFVADLEDVAGGGGRVEARYRVLLTMVPWYERLYCPGRSELEAAEVPLFKAQVEGRKAFKHAAAMGVPVSEVRGRAARSGWEDYRKVGAEMVKAVAGVSA